MICKAHEALATGSLKKFDGSIGDIACHALTATVTDLASSQMFKKKLAAVSSYFTPVLISLEKKEIPILSKKGGIALSAVLSESLSTVPSMSANINFLAAAYFLTAYSRVGILTPASVSEYDDTLVIQKDFPALNSKKIIGEMFKEARHLINSQQNSYLQRLDDKKYHERYHASTTLKATQWTPSFQKLIPDFIVFKLLTSKKSVCPYVVALDMFCANHEKPSIHHALLAYNRATEAYAPFNLETLPSHHPCHVTEGICCVPHESSVPSITPRYDHYERVEAELASLPKVSLKGCTHAQTHLNALKMSDIRTWILAGGADHPQGYESSVDMSAWSDADKKEFNAQLVEYKEIAKTACSPLTGIFPRHDMPSTVGELLKKENLYV